MIGEPSMAVEGGIEVGSGVDGGTLATGSGVTGAGWLGMVGLLLLSIGVGAGIGLSEIVGVGLEPTGVEGLVGFEVLVSSGMNFFETANF